jgi:uncharacterized protein YdaU (DUF1376 family)
VRSQSPAFSFYPKDWLSDLNVKAMSPEAKGAYIDLLAVYWLEEGLPADTNRLARLVGIAPAKFRRLWPMIEPCFQVEDGRLVQKRMEQERANQVRFRTLQRERGLKGGKQRVINDGTNPAVSRTVAGNTLPSPFPSPSLTNERMNGPAGRANPLLADRPKLERECLALVRRMSELTGEEPTEVIARASGYEGAKRTKVNPASMSDDRLILTVRDLRADIAAEEKKRGTAKHDTAS